MIYSALLCMYVFVSVLEPTAIFGVVNGINTIQKNSDFFAFLYLQDSP